MSFQFQVILQIPDVGMDYEVETSSTATTCDRATDPLPSPQTTDTAVDPIFHVHQPILSADKFRSDPRGMHNYTGLQDYAKFLFVFASLGPAVHELNYMYGSLPDVFSVIDRFFMVLVKLRKNYTNFDLSRFFNVSESDVYNVFCTFVRFMSLQWRELNFWPNRDLIHFYAPSGFKADFPKTRVIIDGTEIPTNKPKLPTAQQATYSTYKNRNTVKILAGVTPGGMCSYVSSAYGGAASDRQIVERSSLMAQCDIGDSVMSDKGFDVQDIFAPYHVTINIPTFFKKKNRMSQKTVMHDRKISSKRIHVERYIGIAKSYKILKSPLNCSETLLSSDITFICFTLCNFRSCIVPDHA